MGELQNGYKFVYTNWKSQNSNKNAQNAAYNAGYFVCKKYEVPVDTENQAKKRGNTAKETFKIMTS